MPLQNPACDESRLPLLLIAPEDTAEFQAVAAHVDSCVDCQRKLGEMAARQTEGADLRQFLSDDDLDQEWEDQRRRQADWKSSQSSSMDSLARHMLEPASHPEMLGRLGRYEIESLIGSGGMGIVFKGFDTELNRPVAIKVLAPHLAGSGAARKRFTREARAAAAVVHEHVVAIHNVESEHDPPFLVMHYVSGESLQARLDRQGPLDQCEILRIAFQTAAGLAAAHDQGLVHRDVKPSNILLETGVDRAFLTDFGLARASDDASLTHSGCLPGTPHYMSPEQSRGEAVAAQSDLFSLGSVMYAMCTGDPPFRAETAYSTLRRITDTEPRSIREQNPAIPEWLERIIFKLLAKDPFERFGSAEEVAALLERCLAHVQQPTTTPLPEFCLPPNRFSSRAAIAGVVMMACLIAIFLARPWAWKSQSGTTSPESQPASQEEPTLNLEPTPSENPLTEWDHSQRQLDALDQDVKQLEAEMSRFW